MGHDHFPPRAHRASLGLSDLAMTRNYALGGSPPAEGVVYSGVYYNRATSLVCGGDAGTVAGEGGVSIGRFGWAAPDGRVKNARSSDADLLGFVATQNGDWRRIFWDNVTQSWKIREGFNITLIAAAPGVWAILPGGGSWCAPIYVNPLDGLPVAGYAEGLEPTPWRLARPANPGSLALLTTWNPSNE